MTTTTRTTRTTGTKAATKTVTLASVLEKNGLAPW